MAWSRFEPGFSRHPKRMKAGPVASWLWVASVDHCTEFRTNGFLDKASLASLCPSLKVSELKRAEAALVEVSSWLPCEGGYLVHGYLEHNLSAEQLEADRAASKERYRKWSGKRAVNDEPNGIQTPLQTPPQHRSSNSLPQSVSQSVSHQKPSVPRQTPVDNPPEVSLDTGSNPNGTRPETGPTPADRVLAAAMRIHPDEARSRRLEAAARAPKADA